MPPSYGVQTVSPGSSNLSKSVGLVGRALQGGLTFPQQTNIPYVRIVHTIIPLPPMVGVPCYYGLRVMLLELFNIILRERVFSLPYDSEAGEIPRASSCSSIAYTCFVYYIVLCLQPIRKTLTCTILEKKKGLVNENFSSEPGKLCTQSWFIAPSART